MNATTQIIDILNACGCKPTATTDNNGNPTIKVNAPYIIDAPTLFDADEAEYEYMMSATH